MSKRLTTIEFIERAKNVHGAKYSYENTTYTTSEHNVTITCKSHGDFHQRAHDHIYGKKHGCPKCKGEIISKLKKYNLKELISKLNIIHGDKYTYVIESIIDSHTKMRIICESHGEFTLTPNKHLQGRACPICTRSISAGELKVKEILDELSITYVRQKTFPDLYGYYRLLSYDFYLPSYNAIIEYDGGFHFKPVTYKSNELTEDELNEIFLKTIEYDLKKNQYAERNKIHLLRIPFTINSYNKIKKEILEFINIIEIDVNGIYTPESYIINLRFVV